MYFLSAILISLPVFITCQTAADIQQYATNAFHTVDRNGDGNIDRTEVDYYFEVYDTNHDGQISRHEYTVHITAQYGHDPQLNHILHNLYDQLDTNADHHLTHVDYDNIFAKTDTSGNGLVNMEEFVVYFQASVQAAVGR